MTSPAAPGEPPRAASLVENGSRYAVKLPVFEGPLDLLLHLIRLDEVEITDIQIARIGEQYLAYLDLMQELDLDVAGEYLLMAATLAWIKSRMLLPPDGQEEEGEEGDPRAELVARLLEYQRYKEVAAQLGERRLLGRDVFEAQGARPEPAPDSEREIEVGLFELLDAFRTALKAAGPSGVAHEIEVETVTVRERMLVVMNLLELRESLDFQAVLVTEDGRPASRAMLVASFLAVLELTRLEALRIYQGVSETGVPEGPIHLRRTDGDDWARRVADAM